MLYTSYFANYRNFPENAITVSIAAKPPAGYTGMQFKQLAPSYDCLMQYKNGGSWEDYTRQYSYEVLRKHVPQVWLNMIGSKIMACNPEVDLTCDWYLDQRVCVILLCYEKKDHCHRHVFAQYVNSVIPNVCIEL